MKTTAACKIQGNYHSPCTRVTSAQIKKVSRELGSAGSFARLLPSKICTRPSAVHASDGKILCPFPSLTTAHRAAQPSGKEGEESQTLLLLSSHVSRKTATGRSLALVSCHGATGPILLLNRPHSMSGLVYTSSASEEKQSPLSESDITLRRSAPYNQIDNIRAYDSVNNVRKNVRKRGDGVFSNRWHRKKKKTLINTMPAFEQSHIRRQCGAMYRRSNALRQKGAYPAAPISLCSIRFECVREETGNTASVEA
jgi:hypothetical protein